MNADSPTPATSSTAQTIIVPPAAGRMLHAFGDAVQIKLDAAHTGGAMTVALSITPPRHGPPPHVHRHEDEMFLVVEGHYRYLLADGQWSEPMGPNTVVYTPNGTRHTFENVDDTPSRHWIITTPSGFESFFSRCAEVFAAGGPPDMARILAISDEHGIEYVPPIGGGPAVQKIPAGI